MPETNEEYEYTPVPRKENEEEPYLTETAHYITENGTVNFTESEKKSTDYDRKFLFFAACAGNLAAYTCGTAFGWTSPEIPILRGNDTVLPEQLTESQDAWVGSLLPLGAAIGPFAAGIAADKIGRKKSLLISIIPFIVAFLIFALGSQVFHFYVGRFLCGLGTGIIFTVLPMYIGEISDDNVRGSLGSFLQLFVVIGLLYSYAVGPFVSISVLNFSCVVVPVVFFAVFMIFVPESPYFLVRKNDIDGAEAALTKLRSTSILGVKKELDEIKKSVHEAMSNKASFMDIFKSKGLTKALIISLSLVGFQQLSGINVVLFFAQSIFIDAGSSLSPAIATIIIGVVQILASTVTPVLVEKKGKKFLLLISAIGMAISLGLLALFFFLKNAGNDISSLSWLPIASLIGYIITYCLGFGPLPWAIMGELFPGNVKSSASTATAAFCWMMGFLITKYFSLLSDAIGKSGSFGLFSICCIWAGLFVVKIVPETSGKSLQEIQAILSGDEGVDTKESV